MTLRGSRLALIMAASTFGLCLSVAAPAGALTFDPGEGGCLGTEGGCPHDPPPQVLPNVPRPLYSDGSYDIHTGGSQVSGVRPGIVYGASSSVLHGDDGSTVTMTTTISPLASVFGSVDQTNAAYHSAADYGLFYSVVLSANSQSAADGLNAWLSAGNQIASLHGDYALSVTGVSEAQVSAIAGYNVPGLNSTAFSSSCVGNGVLACDAGAFDFGVNFVSGSATYANSGPLDFYSSIFLNVHARAGARGLGQGVGSASAYIDPMITLDFTGSGLNSSDYALSLGGGVVSNASADGGVTGGVPEPASWALMLTGFGLAGGALRRRRTALAAA